MVACIAQAQVVELDPFTPIEQYSFSLVANGTNAVIHGGVLSRYFWGSRLEEMPYDPPFLAGVDYSGPQPLVQSFRADYSVQQQPGYNYWALTITNSNFEHLTQLWDMTAGTFPPQAVLVRTVTNGTLVFAIPEPETYALMLVGLAAVGVRARRPRPKSNMYR